MSKDDVPGAGAHERLRLRKSLLQLGGLLLLTLLATALLGLFSSWSLERAHSRSETTLLGLLETVDLGRDAQVNAKVQVQEWKNLLLRGGEPTERTTHLAALTAAHEAVRQRLEALDARLAALGLGEFRETTAQTRAAHVALMARYQQALPAADAAWDPFAIDRSVRGIDRPLNEQLDSLVRDLRGAASTRFEQDQLALRARYDALTAALWSAMALAVAVLGILLWRVLRAVRNA